MKILTKILATIPMFVLFLLVVHWVSISWNIKIQNLLWNNEFTTAYTFLFIATFLLFVVMTVIIGLIIRAIWENKK